MPTAHSAGTSHDAERDTRRAVLVPWRCSACNRVLMELDPERPSYIVKACERCKARNIWVEAYRPAP